MPGADWSIFASARAGHGICMSRFATLRDARSSAAQFSSFEFIHPLLAMGVALQKHTYQPHTPTTPQMCHQAHLTPSTSWPNPTYGPGGPPGPILPPLTGEEGTGDGCVLQQLTHPGQGAGVGDGAAHLRIDEFSKLIDMMVTAGSLTKEHSGKGGASPPSSTRGL